MRRALSTAAVLATVAVGVFLATPSYAAGSNVLTTGSVGGPNVAVGNVASSGLKSGTRASFVTTSGGSTGVFCTVSNLTATVTANPAAGGVATETLTAQTFSSCTSNISGVTAVQSITVNNLSYNTSVNGTTKAVSITAGSSGPIQATVKLTTIFGTTTTCAYQANGGALAATASNTDNSITLSNDGLTKSSGPILCPGSSFFSATYAPVKDTSVSGSPAIFVQ